MSKKDKRVFYYSYILIIASMFFEWLGVYLSGVSDKPDWILYPVKAMDYIFTPMVAVAFVEQLKLKNVWRNILLSVLGFNTIFQLISIFTGWMIVVNDGQYAHGPLYFIYIGVYIISIIFIIIEFIIYGKSFKNQNRVSMYMIIFIVLSGIIIQEGLSSNYRTAYIVLTLGASLMFTHLSEFYQLASDDYILKQKQIINTDVLTGILNRYAYSKKLKKLALLETLPTDLVVFTIDINGLKNVNDTLGHDAGDELICGAAKCIENAVKDNGSCYRTGGDEFVIITNLNEEGAKELVSRINKNTNKWKGKLVKSLSLSIGYALLIENPDLTIEKLVTKSDNEMYKAKSNYYITTGKDRRKH